MIDLTNVDNTISPPQNNKPTQESCINFLGVINTDTQTIKGQYHKTVNDTLMKVPPITLATPSLGELTQRVKNQSKLIEEQQRVLNKLQHPHPDQLNSMTAPKVLHPQLPPYDPSIPPPQIHPHHIELIT